MNPRVTSLIRRTALVFVPMALALPASAGCLNEQLTPADMASLVENPPMVATKFPLISNGGSGHYHYSATFLKDVTELVFIMQEEGTNCITVLGARENSGSDTRIYTGSGGPYCGFPGDDGDPAYSRVEDRLYFLSGRETPGGGGLTSWRIWYVDRTGNGSWQEIPTLLEINGEYVTARSLSVTEDGSLWFENNENNLADNGNILRAELTAQGFKEPAAIRVLEVPRNSFCAPAVAPDGSYIVFESYDSEDDYLSDLYVIFRLGDGSWSEPRNPGAAVNCDRDDRRPRFSPDGRILFFSRETLEEGLSYEEYFYQVQWVGTGVILEMRP